MGTTEEKTSWERENELNAKLIASEKHARDLECANGDILRHRDILAADLERSQASNENTIKEIEACWVEESRLQKEALELSRELEKSKTHGSDMVKLEQVQYARASKLEHENAELQEELSAAKQLVTEYQEMYRKAQKQRDEVRVVLPTLRHLWEKIETATNDRNEHV